MEIVKIFLSVIFICYISNSTFAQNNYWVSNSGSDANSGSQLQPWATIEHAINSVSNPTSEIIIINVTNGLYDLNNNQIDINQGFINLTILGQSTINTIIQSASDTSLATQRVFKIYSGNTVTLKNMTIKNGRANADLSGDGYTHGSGIFNRGGKLAVENCKISENISVSNGPTYGVGICNVGGILNISNSTISHNTSVISTTLSIYGGGVASINGNLTIINSTISNNSVVAGGGIAIISSNSSASNSSFTIENSTISENRGYYNYGGMRISRFSGDNNIIVNINSCTIFNNSALNSYGGIGIETEPTSGTQQINIKNSIIAGNTSGINNSLDDIRGGSGNGIVINSEDYNLIQSYNNITFTGATNNNIYYLSPNLEPLAYNNNTTNGTQTCATPLSGISPAIDKIPGGNGAPILDQRGGIRNGDYDIGSFEWWPNHALPVELTSFSAQVKNNKVILNWKTATEINNYGFDVERSTPLNPLSRGEAEGRGVWVKIGFVNGNGNSNSPKNYSFEDGTVTTGKYSYRLKQIDTDGQFEYSNTIEVDLGSPDKFYLSQNFPNPFNPSTVISYQLPVGSQVTLKIFDIIGNEVAALVDEYRNAGSYELEFNVGWDSSPVLASGIYFYRIAIHSDKIQAGNPSSGSGQSFVETKKMILLK